MKGKAAFIAFAAHCPCPPCLLCPPPQKAEEEAALEAEPSFGVPAAPSTRPPAQPAGVCLDLHDIYQDILKICMDLLEIYLDLSTQYLHVSTGIHSAAGSVHLHHEATGRQGGHQAAGHPQHTSGSQAGLPAERHPHTHGGAQRPADLHAQGPSGTRGSGGATATPRWSSRGAADASRSEPQVSEAEPLRQRRCGPPLHNGCGACIWGKGRAVSG